MNPWSLLQMCLLLCAVISAQGLPVCAAPFTPGNIVVSRTGDGVVDIGDFFAPGRDSAFELVLEEYTPAGVLVQSIAMPTTVNGDQRRLTESGSTTGDGKFTRSTNGEYLVIPGYDAPVGTASVVTTSSAAVNRTIGLVKWDGTIDTSTALTDAFDTKQFRTVASNDGTQFWMAGQNDSIFGTGGLRYVANLGDTTSVSLNAGPLPFSNNNQGVHVFDNGGTEQLYLMSRADFPGRGVHEVGTGLPTSGAPELTLLTPPFETERNNGYGFTMVDLDDSISGLDTIYMAFNDMDGGVSKFSLDNAGDWIFSGHVDNGETFNTNERDLHAITAKRLGNDVVIYVLTGETESNRIQTWTDTTGPGGSITGSGGFTTIATLADNYAWRGIAFAPESAVTPLIGDLNGDGFVGIADLNIVLGAWNQNVPPGDPLADPSGDNFVGIADLNIVLGNWNAGNPPVGSAVPEPVSLALLSIGGVALLIRRHRSTSVNS